MSHFAETTAHKGSGQTILEFKVPADGSALLKLQLRIPFDQAGFVLQNPAGEPVLTDQSAAVLKVEAAMVKQPELGDAWYLPEIKDPQPGRWSLVVKHPTATGGERIRAFVSIAPRFALSVALMPDKITVGGVVVVSATLTDYGVPVSGRKVQLQVSRNGNPTGEVLEARERLTNAAGITLSERDGYYLALFTPAEAGRYTFVATVSDWPGADKGSNLSPAVLQVGP